MPQEAHPAIADGARREMSQDNGSGGFVRRALPIRLIRPAQTTCFVAWSVG